MISLNTGFYPITWFVVFLSIYIILIFYFIIWQCLKSTGNKQIQKFDWLKSILNVV